MLATPLGHADTVNALAGTHNADVEAALIYAAWNRHTDIVEALYALGASR
jgi:hypothetical protein